jgi:hypothetical protein
MLLLLPVTSLLLFQIQGRDTALTGRIQRLLHDALTTQDDKQEAAAEAEAIAIFRQYGLPGIAAVGDEAAYAFVMLTCSSDSRKFQTQVLQKATDGAKRGEIPADAASYCAAHLRQETTKAEAKRRTPTNPALRDEIEGLFKTDQAVREKNEFDMEKMERTDREHAPALETIFAKHGVPTYRMVGPQAASDFVTMIQHQSPEFRMKVLPKLKANVDAGEADPGSYATVYDRAQTDAGKKQMYGQNLICDAAHPKLHTGPIGDEEHVNQRRAAIGLMRLELYSQLVVAMSPDVCPAAPAAAK